MNGDLNRGNFIGTHSGIKFFPMDPKAEEVVLDDIAESLGKQCRYTGHTKQFYSVAEHCVHLAQYAFNKLNDKELAKWALMHDASEAYVSYVPRPLKPYLNGYAAIEERVQRVIAERFNLSWPIPEELHEIDTRILFDEAPVLMNLPVTEWSFEKEPLGIQLQLYNPEEAVREFKWAADFLDIR